MTLAVIIIYLALLLGLGLFSNRLFRGTSQDYMLASHSIGPFLLLMSLFGTTMTAFALVGSTGEAFKSGVGVYGMLASASGIIHSACFFLVGVKLWQFGRRHDYTTQIQFFRDRLESDFVGLLLFPILVALVIPYLLVGVISAGVVIEVGTQVPQWAASLAICLVVLTYVFFGGMRGTAWANTFQTLVFMVLGVITFVAIANNLGQKESFVENLQAAMSEVPAAQLTPAKIPPPVYFSFLLIPLSVAMFPHVFQHWLTARSAAAFKLPIVAHPIFIMIVWLRCVLIGVWASSPLASLPEGTSPNDVLGQMVANLNSPLLGGLLTAGILAAIMSSLDSQFLCLGTIFTEDIVLHYGGKKRFSDKQVVTMARCFVVVVVALTYVFSLYPPANVFALGIWCFSGFSGLFPVVLAAIYWRRLTAAGACAGIVTTIAAWSVMFYQSDFARDRYSFPKKPIEIGEWVTIPPMMPVVTIVVFATIATVSVSLITPPPSEKTLAKFFPAKN